MYDWIIRSNYYTNLTVYNYDGVKTRSNPHFQWMFERCNGGEINTVICELFHIFCLPIS